MPDFQFLEDHLSRRWTILAPHRAGRPRTNEVVHKHPTCPFCPCTVKDCIILAGEQEVYRLGGHVGQPDWDVLVINNKYPFAPDHEVIIHSPDNEKNFDRLSFEQVVKIVQVYRDRYNALKKHGQVYIFHNHGVRSGESLTHPHSQLVVVPFAIHLDTPHLRIPEETLDTDHFQLFCPETSQWPDEVWLAPKKRGDRFGDMTHQELLDLAGVLQRLIQIMDFRHGNDFPYNFYIYPGTDWYIRLIPRIKTLGGFELGTNIYVNTQDPKETFAFIQEHFYIPNIEKIQTVHRAKYKKAV